MMHILLYYTPFCIIILGCFYAKMKELYEKCKLERITDGLVEIDNSGISSYSIRAQSLADNTTEIYELNGDIRVSYIPYDSRTIEE